MRRLTVGWERGYWRATGQLAMDDPVVGAPEDGHDVHRLVRGDAVDREPLGHELEDILVSPEDGIDHQVERADAKCDELYRLSPGELLGDVECFAAFGDDRESHFTFVALR